MTQCRVIGIEWPNWESLNYILFSVYREDIRELKEENDKLKSKLNLVIDERDNAFKKIEQLKERIEELEQDYDRLKVAFEDVVSWK